MARIAPRRRRNIGGSGKAAFLQALVQSFVSRRGQDKEQKDKLEQIDASAQARAKAQHDFPDADESLQRLINREIAKVIPRAQPQPSPAQAIGGQFPAQAVPGPQGGAVVGRGQVAQGQPSSQQVLQQRGIPQSLQVLVGQPQVQQQREQERSRALSTLALLSQLGVGGLSRRAKKETDFDELVDEFGLGGEGTAPDDLRKLLEDALAGDAEAQEILKKQGVL